MYTDLFNHGQVRVVVIECFYSKTWKSLEIQNAHTAHGSDSEER